MIFKKTFTAAVFTPVLAASLIASSVSAASFPDVKSSHRAYQAVEAISKAGVLTGFPDGTFQQYQPVTRAQSAILIGRALGIKAGASKKVYTDLSSSSKAYPYVAKLMELGIFGENSRFYPERPLSRSEMAIILSRAFQLPASNSQPFSDVSPGHSAAAYIRALAAAGITTGTGDGKYEPSGTVTRGQMAIFLNNAVNFKTKPETPAPAVPAKPEKEDSIIPDIKPDIPVNSGGSGGSSGGSSGPGGSGSVPTQPQTQTEAVIEARYAETFADLQTDAQADLDSLLAQAKAELAKLPPNDEEGFAEVYIKYFNLAIKSEKETDTRFNTAYAALVADLQANGHGTSLAEKYKTEYTEAKAKMRADLLAKL